jgi:hypothetical protein
MPELELRLVPVPPDLGEGEDALVDPAAPERYRADSRLGVLAGSPAAAEGWGEPPAFCILVGYRRFLVPVSSLLTRRP